MILFVGDKPSPRMKPGANPFEGAKCEQRLRDWMYQVNGYRVILQSDGFITRNIISPLVINQCDYTYIELLMMYTKDMKFISLGNNASKALKDIPHFKLPHPSGRNRQLNDKAFISQKLEECRKWISSQAIK